MRPRGAACARGRFQSRYVKDIITRIATLQVRRPWLPLALVAVITVVFGYFASKLELRTRYDALLPDSQPSVLELRRMEKRISAAQTILVLLEGESRDDLRAMGDAIVPKLLELGPDIVSSAEDGAHADHGEDQGAGEEFDGAEDHGGDDPIEDGFHITSMSCGSDLR